MSLQSIIATLEAEYQRTIADADVLHDTITRLKARAQQAPAGPVPPMRKGRRAAQAPPVRARVAQAAAGRPVDRARPAHVIAREQAILKRLANGPAVFTAIAEAIPVADGQTADQHTKAVGNALFRMKTRQQVAYDPATGKYRVA